MDMLNNHLSQRTPKPIIRPSKESQSVQPHGMASVLIYPSLDSQEVVEAICDQRKL